MILSTVGMLGRAAVRNNPLKAKRYILFFSFPEKFIKDKNKQIKTVIKKKLFGT